MSQNNPEYAAMVEMLTVMGRVMNKLKELDLLKTPSLFLPPTMVVYQHYSETLDRAQHLAFHSEQEKVGFMREVSKYHYHFLAQSDYSRTLSDTPITTCDIYPIFC